MDAVNLRNSNAIEIDAPYGLRSTKPTGDPEEPSTMTSPIDTNQAQRAESFFMSHTWLGVCAVQIALTLTVLCILSIDVEKYMHSTIVLTLEAAVVMMAVCDFWIKLALLGKSAWKRNWFILDAIQVGLLICTSVMLFFRETISWEEFEIMLLWIRVVLQVGRFILVVTRFKNAQNTRRVAADIRLDIQLGGALDRSSNFGTGRPGTENQRGDNKFDVFV